MLKDDRKKLIEHNAKLIALDVIRDDGFSICAPDPLVKELNLAKDMAKCLQFKYHIGSDDTIMEGVTIFYLESLGHDKAVRSAKEILAFRSYMSELLDILF